MKITTELEVQAAALHLVEDLEKEIERELCTESFSVAILIARRAIRLGAELKPEPNTRYPVKELRECAARLFS